MTLRNSLNSLFLKSTKAFSLWCIGVICLSTSPVVGDEGKSNQPTEQELYRSCGLSSLYTLCRYKGYSVHYESLASLLVSDDEGNTTFADIESAASKSGLYPVSFLLDKTALHQLPMPCIIQLRDLNNGPKLHYLLLLGAFEQGIAVLDPPHMAQVYSESYFDSLWTGVAMTFVDSSESREKLINSVPSALQRRIRSVCRLLCAGLVLLLAGFVLVRGNQSCRGKSVVFRYLVLLVISAGLLMVSFGCGRMQNAKALLIVPESMVDLGNIDAGDVRFSVKIINNGDEPITNLKILSSCSCTIPEVPKMILAKATAYVAGTVRARPGPGAAQLVFQMSDSSPSNQVLLKWCGKSPPHLIPSSLRFDLRCQATASQEIEISHAVGGESDQVELLGASGLSDSVHISTCENQSVSVLRRTKIRVCVMAPSTAGQTSLRGQVRFRINEAEYNLPLNIDITSHNGLKAHPSILHVGASSVENLQKGEFSTLVSSDQSVSLTVQSGSPRFAVVSVSRLTNQMHKVTLKFQGSPPASLSMFDLIVADSRGNSLTIPVKVLYAGGEIRRNGGG